jgi:hypothetical protein
MTVPTIKYKKISKHTTEGREYPRITVTGKELEKLDWEIGDEIVVAVDTDPDAEYPVKIKKKQ